MLKYASSNVSSPYNVHYSVDSKSVNVNSVEGKITAKLELGCSDNSHTLSQSLDLTLSFY